MVMQENKVICGRAQKQKLLNVNIDRDILRKVLVESTQICMMHKFYGNKDLENEQNNKLKSVGVVTLIWPRGRAPAS